MSEVKRYLPTTGSMLEESSAGLFIRGSDYDAALLQVAALREELASANECALTYSGQSEAMQQLLTAAEQRNAELTSALARAKLWVEDRRRFGDDGTVAEDWLMIMRTLKGHPHPPTEFDKPTESGASE